MILTRAFNAPENSGLGDDVTLDALLRRLAVRNPAGRAVTDPADRPVFTDGRPRRLSWSELNHEVERLAVGLKGLALGRDAIVAVQLPNIVESVVAVLAVLRAGYIPSLMPLAWRRRDITQALTRVGARAAITVCRAGPVPHAAITSFAAADAFTLRFILAFGRAVPDGVISVDEHLGELKRSESDDGAGDPVQKAGRHVALITWDATAAGLIPVARTHGEVIAAGMAHMLEAGLGDTDVIATTVMNSGIAGFATGLVCALLSGAALVLHQPFSSRVMAGALATEGVTHLILPGAAAAAHFGSTRLSRPLRSFAALWRSGETPHASAASPNSAIDVLSFGEIGFVSTQRKPGAQIGRVAAGDVRSPTGNLRGPCLLETRVNTSGHLALRGTLAPSGQLAGEPSLPVDSNGWIDTGIEAGLDGDGIGLGPARADVARIGGLAFSRPALEEFLRAVSSTAGAALALQRDPTFGEATCAGNGNRVTLASTLDAAGASAALMPRADAVEDEQQAGVA